MYRHWSFLHLFLIIFFIIGLVIYNYENVGFANKEIFWKSKVYNRTAENSTEIFQETVSKEAIRELYSGDKGYEDEKKRAFFFLETSCGWPNSSHRPGGLKLNRRQACAIYSTASLHPDRPVYLYHTCPLAQDFFHRSPAGVKALKELANLRVVTGDPGVWLETTPLSSLLNGTLRKSVYPVEHLSDLLRIALLVTKGGTYMDLDVLTIKSLDKLGSNWVGAQSDNELANGVMDFNKNHKVLMKAISLVIKEYDPKSWAGNGPLLIQRSIISACNTYKRRVAWGKQGRLEDCDLRVLEPALLYPYNYPSWRKFFETPSLRSIEELMDRVQPAHALHLFNKLSSKSNSSSLSPYNVLARLYCSPVISIHPDGF